LNCCGEKVARIGRRAMTVLATILSLLSCTRPIDHRFSVSPRSCVMRSYAARYEYLELHDFLAEDPIAWFHPIRRQQQLSLGGRDESQ
jgi:hypothetical protein